MYRYLKEAHETSHLYFTDDEECDTCIVCGDTDDIIWSYDTEKPIPDTLQSLFDLIVNNSDSGGIIYVEDLELLQKELKFDLDMFNKFKDLLDIKNKLIDIEFRYYSYKNILEDTIKDMNKKPMKRKTKTKD